MSHKHEYDKSMARQMGIYEQGALWERMVSNAKITQQDIDKAKEAKLLKEKQDALDIEKSNPYTNDEMRTHMINECRQRIDDIVTEVKRKELRLSEFAQHTLASIKEIVKAELKRHAIHERNINESTSTYNELEDEWYDQMEDDEEMDQWLEKIKGYRLDRELMLEVVKESNNHIKYADAVDYIKRKYDDDEQELLKQLKEVQDRKAKVVNIQEGIEQRRQERKEAEDKAKRAKNIEDVYEQEKLQQ